MDPLTVLIIGGAGFLAYKIFTAEQHGPTESTTYPPKRPAPTVQGVWIRMGGKVCVVLAMITSFVMLTVMITV